MYGGFYLDFIKDCYGVPYQVIKMGIFPLLCHFRGLLWKALSSHLKRHVCKRLLNHYDYLVRRALASHHNRHVWRPLLSHYYELL
jgi:hypothetical protein